jgi:hypothetical protein
MVTRVCEFSNLHAYERWLAKAGSSVKVVNLSTTKRWGFWWGFLGGAKSYTVTYQLPARAKVGVGQSARGEKAIAVVVLGLLFIIGLAVLSALMTSG